MTNSDFLDAVKEPSLQKARAFNTIVYGGLVVGILDMLFAFTYYGLILKASALRIFQGVAAGVLGRETAIAGGVRTFILGLLLHFVVATCVATVYYLATLALPLLLRYAVISGLVYGVGVYFGMKYLVVPLSAIGQRGRLPRLSIMITEIIGHALLVGLPLGLLARRSARTNRYRFAQN